MTGSSEKSWNSTSNVVIPALLASIEATWISTWIGALAHIAPLARVDVPFLAVALPAACAATLVGASARLRIGARLRAVALAPALFVLAALSAGVVASLYFHAGLALVVSHPFGEGVATASAAAACAWFVAVVAVLRGGWLGRRELRVGHVARSLAVSLSAFVVFFVVAAARHNEASFHAEINPAAVLFLIAFPVAFAVAAVVNERELERSSRLRYHSRQTGASIATVMVPMVAVAAVGALLTYGVGPLVPVVGRLVGAALDWMVTVVGDFIAWISPLFHLRARALPHTVSSGSGSLHLTRGSAAAPAWVAVVSIALLAVVAVTLLLLVIRALRRLLHRHLSISRPVENVVEGERDSVFSWPHLFDQLWRWLFGRWSRFAQAPSSDPGYVPPLLADGARARSVRLIYRSVLVAARAAGRGRRRAETALEFGGRVSAILDGEDADALAALTEIYERARYGADLEAFDDLARAGANAEVVLQALAALNGEG